MGMDGREYSKKELNSNTPSWQKNSNKFPSHSGFSCEKINNQAGEQSFILGNKLIKTAQAYISGPIQISSI